MARFTTARDRKQGTAAIARRAPSPIGTRVPPHLWRLACASGRLYSPGGCGCALLMAPVMAAAMGLAALLLGLAVLAVVCLAIAIALTVNDAIAASFCCRVFSCVAASAGMPSFWMLPQCGLLRVRAPACERRGIF